jgi:hypothetical protein
VAWERQLELTLVQKSAAERAAAAVQVAALGKLQEERPGGALPLAGRRLVLAAPFLTALLLSGLGQSFSTLTPTVV